MTMTLRSRRPFAKTLIRVVAPISLLLGPLLATAHAETVIRHPGQHPQYSFELEPHLAFDWWNDRRWVGDGFGPGVHFAIPFMHQGPITTINNNMAIKFGVDVTFGGGCYGNWRYDRGGYYRYNCGDTTAITLPVALQWNFYITDIITVFGDVGLMIRHARQSYDYNCANGVCGGSYRDTYADLYTAAGAKFMFGQTVGLTVRLGYPSATVGASFLF
jgi:hypothetical protein